MTQSHTSANLQADTKHNNTFEAFISLAVEKRGAKGMLQYHFTDQAAAKNFLNWIHEHKNIKDVAKANIQQSVTDNNTVYIVRLTPEQKNLLNINTKIRAQNNVLDEKEVTQEEINACLLALNNVKLTPAEFKQQLNNYRSEVINIVLTIKKEDIGNWTILHMTARFQPADNFILLLQKISAEALNQALIIQTKDQWTALHIIAHYQSNEAFMQVIAKVSAEALNKALVMQANDQWSALHTIAHYQSNEAFMQVIEKVSAEVLNQALVIQTNNQWIALHIIAQHQSNEAFMQVIAKASAEALNQALAIQETDYRWTALHKIAHHQSNEAFMQVIAKASAEALNQALAIQETDCRWTALHMIARHQSTEVFMQAVQKVSTEALSQALIMQSKGQWTALHTIARHQSSEAFMQVIAKVSAAALNQALVSQNDIGDTALHEIVYFQSEKAVITVIEKASAQALSQACLRLSNTHISVLEEALPYQTPAIIAALLTKIDGASFKFMLTHQHKSSRLTQSLLGYLFFEPSWQIEPLMSRLCSLLTNEIVLFYCEVYLQGKEIPFGLRVALQPYLTNALINLKQTKFSEHYKEIESILSLMSFSDKNLHNDKDNKTLAPDVKQSADFINTKDSKDNKDIKDSKTIKDTKHLNDIKDNKQAVTITTSHGHLLPVTVDDEKNLKLFYREGLKSPYDYHLLKKYKPNGIITQIADSLHRADRLYTGTTVELDLSRYQAYSDHYLEIATQGHAVFKIIKDGDYKDEKKNLKNDWNDFKKQLSDYRYRPALRKPKSADAQHRYKLHHRTGSIIDYKESKLADKKKTYLATKKQSATLLSKNLNTTVFGEHVPGRMLVGILAGLTCNIHLRASLPPAAELISNEYIFTEDKKQTRALYYIDDNKTPHQMPLKVIDEKHNTLSTKPLIHWTEDEKKHLKTLIHDLHDRRVNKALLTRDKGTYLRGWIGDEKDVKNYQNEMKDINYTDFDKFREKVNQQSHQLNEILTKFTKHSILAIMIVSDDLASRKVAITRRVEMKNELNIDLPIIFYNRNLRTTRVYSLAEQLDDLMQTNLILQVEQLQKLNAQLQILQLIKKCIREKYTWNYGFFKGHKTSLPDEMKQILSLIVEAEKDSKKANEVYKKVDESLTKNSQKSIFRAEDVEHMSQELHKLMIKIKPKI